MPGGRSTSPATGGSQQAAWKRTNGAYSGKAKKQYLQEKRTKKAEKKAAAWNETWDDRLPQQVSPPGAGPAKGHAEQQGSTKNGLASHASAPRARVDESLHASLRYAAMAAVPAAPWQPPMPEPDASAASVDLQSRCSWQSPACASDALVKQGDVALAGLAAPVDDPATAAACSVQIPAAGFATGTLKQAEGYQYIGAKRSSFDGAAGAQAGAVTAAAAGGAEVSAVAAAAVGVLVDIPKADSCLGMTYLPQLTSQEVWQLTGASAALGFPKRPTWQGVASSAAELHQLEEEAFAGWQNHMKAAATQAAAAGAAAGMVRPAACTLVEAAVGCDGKHQQGSDMNDQEQPHHHFHHEQERQVESLQGALLQENAVHTGDDDKQHVGQQGTHTNSQKQAFWQDPPASRKGRKQQRHVKDENGSVGGSLKGEHMREGLLEGSATHRQQQPERSSKGARLGLQQEQHQQQQQGSAANSGRPGGTCPAAPLTRGQAAAGDGGVVSFFEGRLDFWRQLWRTLELADVVLMVVDARNPLLHFSEALWHHITIDHGLLAVLLLNKCDLVPAAAVAAWSHFFSKQYPGLHVVPVSTSAAAKGATARSILQCVMKLTVQREGGQLLVKDFLRLSTDEVLEASAARNTHAKRHIVSRHDGCPEDKSLQPAAAAAGGEADMQQVEEEQGFRRGRTHYRSNSEERCSSSSNESGYSLEESTEAEGDSLEGSSACDEEQDMTKDCINQGAVAGNELGQGTSVVLHSKQQSKKQQQQHCRMQPVVLGVVGEPNVGKSSLLNVLLGSHRVAVSSHPGRTKHVQTHYMTPQLMVCDCPGLVFPRYQVSLPMQVLFGSYPIAHCRSPYKVVQYLAERSWPPLQVVLGLGAGNMGSSTTDGPPGSATAAAAKVHVQQCQQQQQQQESSEKVDKVTLGAPAVARVAAEQGRTAAVAVAHEGGQRDEEGEVTWMPMALCEGLAKKRHWCNRKGGRLDTYKAANWILRSALAGGKGIGLCFLPPS